MKTLVKLSLVVVAVLAAVGLFSASLTAYAQGPQGGRGGMMGRGGPDDSLVAIAAKTLGMTQTELVTALQGGKTIAAVAKDKGVVLDKIVDAFIAERQTALKAAVASQRMTQAQADSMIAMMKTNVLARLNQPFTPRGPGFVDANKDGVCDNCGIGRMGGQGTRPQGGPRRGW
jgi:hypothetical protein